MTDPGPFVPPSGALPPRSADPALPPPPTPVQPAPVQPAPVLPAPVLPPPTGLPIGAVPPMPPIIPPPPRRPWLVPVIVGGVLVVVALVAGAAFVAVQIADRWAPPPVAGPSDDAAVEELEPLLVGDPGSPVAVDPLDCAVCFDVDDALTLGLAPGTYAALGLPLGDGSSYETTAGDDQGDQSAWWGKDGGTPDSCYFTYPSAPLFFAPDDGGGAAGDDAVHYPEWHSDVDEYAFLTEAVRVFDGTASATAYLAELETAVAGCPSFAFPESGWSAAVTPAPALDLPPSVAAYGWVESGGAGRYYAVDVQRGNLVARITLTTDAYGPTEADFRGFVEEYAEQLAALEPAA